MVLLLLSLIGGLAYFQILKGDEYVELASRNRLRVVRLSPPRGVIRDANGVPLAVNVRTFDVKAYPMDLQKEGNMERVAALFRRKGIPMDASSLAEAVEKQYVAPYRAVSVVSNLTLAQVADLMGEEEFRGLLFPFPVWRRVYPAGDLVAHVVGYVGEVTKEELEELEDPRYQGGDVIGKNGIEAWYEQELRGEVGEDAVEVDARGRKLKDVSHVEPVRGKDVTLTLDLGAQRLAANLMSGQRGALIAMDVRDGSVKVLFSSPTFDPNPLTWGISAKEWRALITDRDRPMMNRAVSGTYPPASTFKVVTAIAALEEGLSPVAGGNHGLIIRHDPYEVHRQDLQDVVHAEHVLLLHHVRPYPVDDQPDGGLSHGLQQAYYPVRVPHRRDLRGRHHQGLVGPLSGVPKTRLYPRRAVHQDVIKVLPELGTKALHLLGGHRILGPGLSGRYHVQVVHPLVLDHSLIEPTSPLHHIHEGVDYPVLKPHNKVQVSQPYVPVNGNHSATHLGQRHRQVGGGRGLANPPLAGGNHYDLAQFSSPQANL